MGGRERALAALDHREPDRIPVDLGGTIVTVLHVGAYGALRSAATHDIQANEPPGTILAMVEALRRHGPC